MMDQKGRDKRERGEERERRGEGEGKGEWLGCTWVELSQKERMMAEGKRPDLVTLHSPLSLCWGWPNYLLTPTTYHLATTKLIQLTGYYRLSKMSPINPGTSDQFRNLFHHGHGFTGHASSRHLLWFAIHLSIYQFTIRWIAFHSSCDERIAF